MSLKKPANLFLNELMQKWQQLQLVPNVFAYKLEVTQQKYLPGKYQFYSEFNPQRTALRRPPQTILSMDPEFNEEKFNFKKVAPAEIIMKLKFEEDTEISFIINNSPLTKYHTLICPNVEKGLPQRITLDALRFCVDFLLSLEGNRYFRIGYNSPGALASVNHLHLHLMLIEKELYIDHVKLQNLYDPDIYRLDPHMPTQAICFLIDTNDSKTKIELKLLKLYKFLMWLCDNNMPHNIFMTPVEQNKKLKIFIFAREEFCIVKQLNTINIGFCELAGYVPVGIQDLYDPLTEQDVIVKINLETGQNLHYLSDPDIYRLDPTMPTEAICFIIDTNDSKTKVEQKLDKLYKFLIWLCDNNIPHNVLLTPAIAEENKLQQKLNIFIYAREKLCVVKHYNTVNLGFSEFSGYVPVGVQQLYDNLSEQDVIEKINSETGQIYTKIYKYFKP